LSILRHCRLSNLGDAERRGTIHRLDEDMTGLIILAESGREFRSVKEYFGLAQRGIVFLACKMKVSVIPVHIFGTYDFYL
jgi:hypothetical protein